MITQICTLDDVKAFAMKLTRENVAFHPDDDFNDYVNFKTGLPVYTEEEAISRNLLMNSCFELCDKLNVDIYDLMLHIYIKGYNLNTMSDYQQ